MKFDKVGIYAPAREDLYRKEEINKRLGKTRIKGKIRGPSQSFVDRMKIEDAADGVLDQVFYMCKAMQCAAAAAAYEYVHVGCCR